MFSLYPTASTIVVKVPPPVTAKLVPIVAKDVVNELWVDVDCPLGLKNTVPDAEVANDISVVLPRK